MYSGTHGRGLGRTVGGLINIHKVAYRPVLLMASALLWKLLTADLMLTRPVRAPGL